MSYSMLTVIVDAGKGTQVLRLARNYGIHRGSIFFGKGTVPNIILDLLCLSDIKKEIVFLVEDTQKIKAAAEGISNSLNFHKKNQGICYITSVSKPDSMETSDEAKGKDDKMHDLITAIVEFGMAEELVEEAVKHGAKGATIMHARGSGDEQQIQKVFAMEIEPEKEVVLMVTSKKVTKVIVESLTTKFNFEDENTGILLVQSIDDAYGLYQE